MTDGKDVRSLAEPRAQLWQALGECDETRAVAVVRGALHTAGRAPAAAEHQQVPAGVHLTAQDTAAAGRLRAAGERVLLELIAPAQERVGLAWAADDITVAQEHAATAISERCVAAVADATAPALAGRSVGRVVVSCVDGEWHSLPARLVGEVLRLRGWRVDQLGAQVPTEHLVAYARRTRAQAVLLSSSIPTLLPGAHNAISSCQAAGIPVLAGGAAFGPQGRYARLMRAEWAKDAPDAATLLGRRPTPPGAHAARLPDLDLPHLADQEYTMVRRTRLQLVKQTLADVEEGFPETRHYSERQLERTVEDIDFIVSHLATALYVDDPDLFTTFITWTADILAARDIPPRCLLPALDSLRTQLKDFPRAVGILTAARGVLTPPPAPPG
ncbi:cobalamin-binding protein [Streptomyces dioscori]|uniref:Cobalamin-binding protein n=1 Tax=Streptomyces dioscori TaxID=2109333 RepID=A0A2P8Q4E8_9ACTN|nr:cobalamin B12-binding domain-containing protein [Streptomyces dioscori]PSM41130.1 cobalamin-binding protein [Streptomyces dioscori]